MCKNEDDNSKNDIANIYDMLCIIWPGSKNVIEFHNPTEYLLILVGILAGIESLSKFILTKFLLMDELKITRSDYFWICFVIIYISFTLVKINGFINIRSKNESKSDTKKELSNFFIVSLFKPIFIVSTIIKKALFFHIFKIIFIFLCWICKKVCTCSNNEKNYTDEHKGENLKWIEKIKEFLDDNNSEEIYYDLFDYPKEWGDKEKYFNKVLRFATYKEGKKVSFDIRKRKKDSKYLIRYTTLEDLQNPDKYGTVKEYDESMYLKNPRNKEKKILIKEFNKVFKE